MLKVAKIDEAIIKAPLAANHRPGQMLRIQKKSERAEPDGQCNIPMSHTYRRPKPNEAMLGSGTFGFRLPSAFKNLSGRKE